MVLDATRWQDPVRPAPGFLEVTGATLLVGRLIPFRGPGEELLARWDAWSSLIDDADRCAIPAHDLSRFEEYVGFDGRFRIALGIAISTATADEGPSAPFTTADVERAQARAAEHLPDRLLDRVARDLAPADAWALRTQRTRPLLVPFGPIASARLASGTLARALDPIAPGATRVRGRDMRGRAHPQAVDGTTIAVASDWDVAEPDLRAAALRLRGLEPEGTLHLVARYD